MHTEPCRIGLLVQDPLLRELLANALATQPDLEVAVATGDPARLAEPGLRLELVLADAGPAAPPQPLDALLAAARAACPGAALAVLHEPGSALHPGVGAPAAAGLARRPGLAELAMGVRAAVGRLPAPANVARPADDEARRLARLSRRQAEVLAHVERGCDNAAIAKSLGITPRTVKAHMALLYKHLGVANRVQLALLAQRHRLKAGPVEPVSVASG